ncbi:MAG: histidine kinase [Niastella sp.]|nr:histidine kinase [Niastella sp.]
MRNVLTLLFTILLFSLLHQATAQEQPKQQDNRYYQFSVLYNHPDGFTYENYYYLTEGQFKSYNHRTSQLMGFPGSIQNDAATVVGRFAQVAGFGIRYNNSTRYQPGYSVRVVDREYPSSNIFDSSRVLVIAFGINPANAVNYEYRVVTNNQVIVKDWAGFTQFKEVPETGYRYAVVGEFVRSGGYLLIEARHKQTQRAAGITVLNWTKDSRLFLEKTRVYFKEDNPAGINGYLEAALLKKGYATGKDSTTGILHNLKLPADKEYENIIFDLNGIEFTTIYRARLERLINGVTDTVDIEHNFNATAVRVVGERIARPGKYRLLVGGFHYFTDDAGKAAKYDKWILKVPFEILPPPALSRTWTLRQILPYAVALVFIPGLLFYSYYRLSRRRLKRTEQEKQLKQLQLRSLQDQLNPHFLFNALGAIQNLVGKNELQPASRYLDRFSLLTRTILTNSHHEMISLEDELRIQQAYLEMEQLRTPFNFNIIVDKDINVANTEIPLMLLQPFVENAVKHGVTPLSDGGMITLEVRSDGETLIFIIMDNGKGIQEKENQPTTQTGGFGLSLVAKRVKLLNEMYGAPLVSYIIDSGDTGTRVTVYLKNWLS